MGLLLSPDSIHFACMGKSANLSEQAYAALQANKLSKRESLSQVIVRLVPQPIRTFGDLEKHLEDLDQGVIERIDLEGLQRLCERKRKANRAH